MKRSSESAYTSDNGREKVARRQEPVSCLFCRKKKLKCDRGAPCSNCKARKLECSSTASGVAESSQAQKSFETPGLAQPGASSQNIDELNTRIKKLEELLISQSTDTHTLSVNRRQPPPVLTKDEPRGDIELTNTLSFIESDAYEHAPNLSEDSLSSDAKVAESFGTFIFALTRPRSPPAFTQNLATTLPPRAEGQILLEYYVINVNWIYQIIHVPTVRKTFDLVYTKIEQSQLPEYGHIAIIATIFALSAYFSSRSSGLYFSHDEAKKFSYRWVQLAQHALAASNCLSVPTVETLQSLILIAQHIMPNIGAIATLRTLACTAMHVARSMGLHKIDTPTNKARRQNMEVDWVDVEVKRRIWWHLASTDWLLSFMSGAQCGTYMIHPKQMNVDHPTNVDDTAIAPRGDYAQPIEYATDMTYFIFRVKFATVFREMVDLAWEAGSDMDELPFELVLDFDKRLNALLNDFDKTFDIVKHNSPIYDSGESRVSASKLALLSKQRQMARNMAHFGVHTRLSRLHRPYLVRGAQDPRYAYSRMVCLRSARTVIEIGKKMTTQIQDLASIKIWSVNHHVFVSTVILVMDYCYNREEPRAKERKEEILECFRILESSREDSTIATRGLQKLRTMLQKNADNSSGDESTGTKNSFAKRLSPQQQQQQQQQYFQSGPGPQISFPNMPGDALPTLPSQQLQWDLGSLDYDFEISQFEALFQFGENSRELF